jgi:hypothetical protein
MGRPPKRGHPIYDNNKAGEKVVRGGSARLDVHIYFHGGAGRKIQIVQGG